MRARLDSSPARGLKWLRVSNELLCIGVDGGASEVKVHEVLVLAQEPELVLGLGAASASCCYDLAPGFAPVDVGRQLVEHERSAVDLAPAERAQGRLWIEAAARSIAAIAAESQRRALVGICMPGLKTRDRRGVAVVRNGPRIPDFLDRLEEEIVRAGIALAAPIGDLIGDGEACGLGENFESHGALRDVANAYYVGGGTGVAEALKLDGRVVSFDAISGSIPKAWQLSSARGVNFESSISMGGINAEYARRTGRRLPLARADHPEARALAGDTVAADVLGAAAEDLAELVFLRLDALRSGAAGREHVLERVVLGQQLAPLFGSSELAPFFRSRVESALAERIRSSGYGDGVARGFLRASSLRAAPAIGAAAAALGGWRARA